MPSLPLSLKRKLKDATRVLFLGVGSDLRGDDAAGILLAKSLQDSLHSAGRGGKTKVRPGVVVEIMIGDTAPENLTGHIRKFGPSHLVILDATSMDKKPGATGMFTMGDVGGMSFSTHRLPLSMMVEYLAQFGKFETILLAIQPASLSFGAPVSKAVEKAVASLTSDITRALAP